MNITIVTISNPVISDIIKAADSIKRQYGDILKLKLFYAGRKNIDREKINIAIKNSDAVIVDLMGASNENQKITIEICKNCKAHIIPIGGENSEIRAMLRLGTFSASEMKKDSSDGKKMNMETMQKMINMTEKMGTVLPFGKLKDMKNYIHITKYWMNAGEEELKNLLFVLLRDYGNIKNLPKPHEPMVIKEVSICTPHNMEYFNDIKSFTSKYEFNEEKSLVAILYYGKNYPNRTSHCVAYLVDKIRVFSNVLPIAFTGTAPKNLDELKRFLDGINGRKPDIILNFIPFRLGAGPMGGDFEAGLNILEEAEAQYIHPFFMSKKEINEWKESQKGLNPSEFLVTLMLPELDGALETIPVGALKISELNKEFDVEVSELSIIEERVDRIVEKIKAWLRLREKPNKEKKLAIVCYNYPPGEGNLFGGAFLDTFTSMEEILKALKGKGYSVNETSKEYLMNSFKAGKIVNSARWDNENSNYMIRYPSLKYKESFQDEEVLKDWGKVPEQIMTEENDFLIPGLISGNIFIGLQPTRGVHENPEKVYHDKNLSPHHQYIAFYKWIREEFKADVIIHVGTHGTLEFLKGKECGMSGECYPDRLIGDLPHIYLYYCGNPSEAVIAKRRSQALTIGYQSPPFKKSELYGELSILEKLISEYKEAEILRPTSCDEIKKEIIYRSKEININNFNLDDIEKELYRIKNSLIPMGLHVFGKGYNKEEAVEYVKSILRYDRGECKALKRILAESKNINYDNILKENSIIELTKLEEEASQIVEKCIDVTCMEEIKQRISSVIQCNSNIFEELNGAIEFGKKALSNSIKNYEMDGLLKALNGRYLKAKIAGDTIRTPEVFPTGFNLYQFDPRLVPSKIAANRGVEIAHNTIECYKNQYKKYPLSAAVILWGLETSRTHGETIGQVLYYLGVRVKDKKSMYEPSYEIIPINELGRPRIDVVINICGFFRDMFPNILEDFNKIFKMLWELSETDEENYFKANSKKIYNKLIGEGYSKEEALELSCARIFGPKEAEYGTSITKLIETSNWTSETQIGEQYVKSLKHVYSTNFRGKEFKGLLERNLEAADIVSQIRSSNEYEVTDLDHYYEFFGGLSKSIEIAKGKKAEVYISDTTSERVETETIDKSIARGVRTRLLNPKWIDAMLEHKYHGVQKISERFENILGLAATTNKVDNWIFSSMNAAYIEDKVMRKRMIENNKWAYLNMVERLMECNKRGYWQASEEEIKNLREVYLEIDGEIEEEL